MKTPKVPLDPSELIYGLIITALVLLYWVWDARKIWRGERHFSGGHFALLVYTAVLLVAWFHGRKDYPVNEWEALSYVFQPTARTVKSMQGIAGISAVMVFFAWFFGFNRSGCGVSLVRGSLVVDGEMVNMRLHGKKWAKDASKPTELTVGVVRIPHELEAQHFLFSGTTGSGKTQAINKVLGAVRARQLMEVKDAVLGRALIADAGGGFLSRFYQDGDLIFNPFDARSVEWSPFAEIVADYDAQRIAKAAIPDASGESQEWHHYAQTLLAETMLALHRQGEKSVKRLMHYLAVASNEELGVLLAGTPAVILCAKGNEKMLGNTRGIISTYLVAWRYLKDEGTFSIREWVRREDRKGWLFITYRDDQLGLLRVLVATLFELGIVEGLSLTENDKRDLWYVFDEVDSLGKISSLRAGLTKLRKYGGKVVLGLQTISQLRATYGRDEAQTLLANVSTKVVLRAGDGETAEYFSNEFGMQQIEREQVSYSESSSDHGESESETRSRSYEHQRTILASEIAGLQNLAGYIKLPGVPIGTVTISYEKLEELVKSFIDKKIAKI